MWADLVAPYFELPSDINEWKIEQFWYEEILLFGQFYFKNTLLIVIPSVDADLLLPYCSDWVLLKNIAVNIFSKYLPVLIYLLIVCLLNAFLHWFQQWSVRNILMCTKGYASFSIDVM